MTARVINTNIFI